MKEIIIKFEPFIFKQTVFIKEDNKITRDEVPQKELANYISSLKDVDKIHLFGNKKFAEKIKEECLTKYEINNLEILINS